VESFQFGVQRLGFTIEGFETWIWDLDLRLGFGIYGFWFLVYGIAFRVWDVERWGTGVGCRVND